MRRIILSSMVCLNLPYFPTLCHKRHNFSIKKKKKKAIEHKMCVLIFSINFLEIFLILKRIQKRTVINVHRSSCKMLVVLARF